MLIEVFLAGLGGAVSALGIAAYLSRAFLKLQSEKILARHTQALAIEKERLGHDLAVEFHQKSIAITRREKDRTEALKSLHTIVVNLGEAVMKLPSLARINKQVNFEAAYFTCLASIFNELSATFNHISKAHITLELETIYLDTDTEQKIKLMLMSIQNYYNEAFTKTNEILINAKSMAGQLSETTQPANLFTHCSEIVTQWNLIIEPSKKALRDAIREALMS